MHIAKGFAIAVNVAACIALAPLWIGVWAKTQGEELSLNTSKSLPRGFYISAKNEGIERGVLIGFPMPEVMRPYVKEFGEKTETFHYGSHFVLLKKVVALPGDIICRDEIGQFTAAGTFVGTALEYALVGGSDASHHASLPTWTGCLQLRDGEVAVGSSRINDSMDSRYFGPVDMATAVVYKPLLTE